MRLTTGLLTLVVSSLLLTSQALTQVTKVTTVGGQQVDSAGQGEPAMNPAKRNDIYTVDPASGQLTLHIPILSLKQGTRGPALAYTLDYTSSAGYPYLSLTRSYNPQYVYSWKAETQGPWTEGVPHPAPFSSATYSGLGADGTQDACYEHGPYVLVDQNGSAHDLGLVYVSSDDNGVGLCQDSPVSVSTMTMDGVPLRSQGGYGAPLVVQRPDGTTLTFGSSTCPGEGPGSECLSQIEDANGNLVTVTYSSNTEIWRDAAGKTILEVLFNGSGPTINSIITYDSSGTARTYTLQWTTVSSGGFPVANPNTSNCPYPGDCSTATEDLAGGGNEITSLSLPDGTSYGFGYDSVTGALNQISLPTGGSVAFTYTTIPAWNYMTAWDSNGPEGLIYDGLAVKTETRSDGASWSYSYSGNQAGPTESTTIVDPTGAKTVITYDTTYLSGSVGGGGNASTRRLEAQRQIYSPQGALLRTITTGNYAGDGHPGSVQTTLNDGSSVLTRQTDYHYDPYYNVAEQDDWDYVNCGTPVVPTNPWAALGCAPATRLRKTSRSFLASYTASPWIVDRPTSEVVYDGGGNTLSSTSFEYDNYNHAGQAMTASGATQHDPVYSTGYTARGNLTAISRWVNTSGASLTTTRGFDDAGNLVSSIDPANHETLYGYGDSWANTTCAPVSGQSADFQTSETNALGQETTFKYNSCTGSLASKTDPNLQTWSWSYDLLNRETGETLPDGGQTAITYTDAPNAFTVETQRKIDSSRWTNAYVSLDSLGREVVSTSFNGAGSWDRTDTCFDGLDRVSFRSYPFASSNATGAPNCSGTGDSFAFDGLSRPIQTTHSDGSTFLTSYAGRDTETQDEGNGTGARVTRLEQSDGLARLTGVCEVVGGAPPGKGPGAASCGLDTAGSGFLTSYAYAYSGGLLTTITQGGLTRSSTIDSLGRVISAANPETGNIVYRFDTDNNCTVPSFPGDLISRTDARGIRTCHRYDALHREIERDFSDGATPTMTFGYDQSAVPGYSGLLNNIGRLSSEATAALGSTPATSEVYQHDPVGRIWDSWPTTPESTFQNHYVYDALGDPLTSDYSRGATLTATYNVAGQPVTLWSSATGGYLVSSATYDPRGQELTAALGNGVAESRSYTARGWVNAIGDGSSYSLSSVSYAGDGDLLGSSDSVNGTYAFGFNDLNQLTSASCSAGPCAGDSAAYTFDRYGNRWTETVAGFSPSPAPPSLSFNGNNNRMDGGSYDASGNLLSDGTHSYQWDAENRLVSVDGGTTANYLYDAEGRRVHENVGGVVKEYVYGASGQELSIVDGSQNLLSGETYLGGHYLGSQTGSGFVYAYSDNLGSVRARTTGDQDTNWPFGEFASYQNGTSQIHFTGKLHDTETGLEYFGARDYDSSLSRFMTPDWSAAPEAVPYADITDPQSLNLYSYVLNNPVTNLDADGHIVDSGGDGGTAEGSADSGIGESVDPTDTGGCQQTAGCLAPPNLTYKKGVPLAGGALANLVECTAACTGEKTVVTSTKGDTKVHKPTDPHEKGEAADLRVPKGTEKATLKCAASCGAKFALDEREHPSKGSTGPHVHVQTVPGTHGGRGDLPHVKKDGRSDDGGTTLSISYSLSTHQKTTGNACQGLLPDGMATAIREHFPGAHIVVPDLLENDDRGLWDESHPRECPGVGVAKFDGIHLEYAVTLIEGSGASLKQALVVLRGPSTEPKLTVLSPWSPVNNPNVIYILPPGRYTAAEGSSSVRSAHSVIALEAIEAGVVIFYWRNGAFHRLTTSE